MFKRSTKNTYANGFLWQGDLPLTELSCTHFVRVFPCLEAAKYITDESYREEILNDAIALEILISDKLFGIPIELVKGNQAILWGELLKPPPTHQIIVGYVIKTGAKEERRIIDVKVSFTNVNRSEKVVSDAIGRYYVQLLKNATDRWSLFRSGENTRWYLTCLQAKYKNMRDVLG